jgi:hypothetical protein
LLIVSFKLLFLTRKNFSVKNCYYALNFGGVSCAGNQEIWNSALKKCKIISWLAFHNQFSTKERPVRRGFTRLGVKLMKG